MYKTTKRIVVSLTAGMLLISAAIAGVGCASDAEIAKGTNDALADGGKTGNQIWTDNCARCHNLRGPETFSGTQWEIISHHMRIRANLTGSETRKVTAFLKSAS